MPVIELRTEIAAPIERVFDPCRSVRVHLDSAGRSREALVAGPTGLLELGDEVTWEATHFGVRQRLTSRITRFDRPIYFRDSMVRGAFARFQHDHFFEEASRHTLAHDRIDFTSPLGLLGRFADLVCVERYMRRFLHERAEAVRRIAETELWRAYLSA